MIMGTETVLVEFARLAAVNLGLVIGLMILLWAVSIAMRDSSIADIYWGTGLAITAWFTFLISDGVAARRWLVLALATAWGLRLSLYILWRNWGTEDPRYARFRKHIEEKGGNYAWHSLKHVYLLQGFIMWLVALVLIFAVSVDAPAELGALAWAGAALSLFGMVFESVGDLQLARFKRDQANGGKVMDRGLWRYTRHPNYFGEACVWIGFFLIAVENPAGLVTIVSPAAVLYALLGPTGKPLLERRMQRRRPEFEDYVRRTSGFLPLPPRRGPAAGHDAAMR
jgi:steroid 5-alpha reductase family enzyme